MKSLTLEIIYHINNKILSHYSYNYIDIDLFQTKIKTYETIE
jgi:hypothetical protein